MSTMVQEVIVAEKEREESTRLLLMDVLVAQKALLEHSAKVIIFMIFYCRSLLTKHLQQLDRSIRLQMCSILLSQVI